MDRKLNVLLITSDQQHYDTIGAFNPRISTPALDRLAAEGSTFERAYCPNPTCSPTRASIITGLYPSAHGCWTLGTKLDENVPTVGEMFQRHGYRTTLVGKAHWQPLATADDQTSIECQPTLRDLDFWRSFHGPWYGFEHVETARMHADESHAGGHYAIWMEERGLKNWQDFFEQFPPNPKARTRLHHWDLPEEFHYSTWTAERTIANIKRSAGDGKPFFLWASFHDPHPPYLVPAPWDTMYDPADMQIGTLADGEMACLPPHFGLTQQATPDFKPWRETQWYNHGMHSHLIDPDLLRRHMAVYYGMVSLMDKHIGRILDYLDQAGLADDTLVVFTTDHGHFMGQHGLTAKGPFLYEDLVRVPFLVRCPARVPAGRRCQALQSLVDLSATFLSACGIETPAYNQGADQWATWCGQAEPARDHVFVEHHHQPTTVHLRSFIDERYKLTLYRDRNYGELFDLIDDPGERVNRWSDPAWAAIKSELMRQMLYAELAREPMRYPRIAHA